jgi:1-acyl-sn-glycerol-3-phosphate acyltransferase
MIRSALFNILFFLAVGVMCVACLPGLLLPHRQAQRIVTLFVETVYFLERHILGLDYEVRGREHLPQSGAFIVAAKHESAYETFKMHIVFRDPAIILKKELLRIPLWGAFLKKSDPIAIDRGQAKKSIMQLLEGAKRVQAQGRPLIVFPQGTRVRITDTPEQKPYRSGAARMQEATGMPIIPMALNSGCFWPKGSWRKRGGRVVFELLPPIPAGGAPAEVTAKLQAALETASGRLHDEARQGTSNERK